MEADAKHISRTFEILAGVPLFEELPREQLERLSRSALIRSFERNAVIVIADQPGDSMMIILDGQVKVQLTNPDGKEIILSHLYAGDFFGEMSLIDPAPRSASVITVEKTMLAIIARDLFVKIVHESPDVLMKMAATMCQRLRQSNEKIADLAFRDASGRVAHYLVELAETTGRKQTGRAGETYRVTIPSHKDIAALLGTTRETISRVFAQFRDAEFIVGENKCWQIACDKLRRLAN